MKNRLIPFIALTLLTISSACTSETSQPDEPDQPAPESVGTLTIRIAQSDFTRATDDETKVKSLKVVFLKDYTLKEIVTATPSGENSSVFKVKVPGTITDHPNGIIAYANCATNDQRLDALKSRMLDKFGNTTDGFVMNSVSSFDESGKEKMIIPVSFEHFTESGKAVDLNLERLCAKVTLNKDASLPDTSKAIALDPQNKDQKIELGVYLTLDGWLLSCIDTQTYLFKNYNGEMPTNLWWLGNGEGHPSTHWAFSSKYGDVPSPQNNNEASKVSGVKYVKIGDKPKDFNSSIYCHETTRPQSTYDNPNSQPSIVLVGTYRISENAEAEDLYRLSDGTFKTKAQYWELIAAEPAMLKKLSGETTADDLNKVLSIDNHVSDKPDRIVEIRLKNEITTEELAPYGKTLDDVETINTYLKEKFGYAEKYYQGKCYFVFPIQHSRYNKELPLASQEEGAFGIVRNHHYTITLKGITGVGYGVADGSSYLLQADYDPTTPQYSLDINTAVNDWSAINGQTIE